jgi:putative ABC transport system permease protein
VLARRRDIGLLKAAGVTPVQVVAAITLEHLLLGLLGVVLGWALGASLVPSLRVGVMEVLEPGAASWSPSVLAVTAVVMAVIVAVATITPAVRAARLVTAQTLRPPVDPGRSAWPARAAGRLGAGPVVLGGVKDATQRPLRTTLAALSVVLAVVAMLVTLSFGATVDRATSNPDLTGDPWDAVVVPAEGTEHGELTAAIAAVPGVVGWFGESGDRRVVDGEVLLARAVWGDPAAAGYVIREGRNMTAAGEALAGYGLLQRLGREVGDTVVVDVEDVSIDVRIVGRYSETEDTGEVLLFRSESLAGAFPEALPDVYHVVGAAGTDREQLAASLQSALGDEVSVRPLVVEADEMDAFAITFWSVAALVLAVALANLGATVLLGVRERSRDLGVLRAIGFTPSQLVASTAISTLLLVLAAVVVGVPLGLWLSRMLLVTVGKAMGAGPELGTGPQPLAATVLIGIIVAVAVGIGALACRQVSRRPVSELVQHE